MVSKSIWKIEFVVQRTGCDRATAIEYLEAEEWDEEGAVTSLKGDREVVAC